MITDYRKEIAELKDKIEDLEKRIAEPEPFEKWVPELGKDYYYVGCEGCINSYTYCDDPYDKKMSDINNCFPTREAAEAYRDFMKLAGRLYQMSGGEYECVYPNVNSIGLHFCFRGWMDRNAAYDILKKEGLVE